MPIRIPDNFTMPVALYKTTLKQLTADEKAVLISLYYSMPAANFIEIANNMKVRHYQQLLLIVGGINKNILFISSFKSELRFAEDIIDKREYNLVYTKLFNKNTQIGWKMQKHLSQALEELEWVIPKKAAQN